jgi:hypothetical protein
MGAVVNVGTTSWLVGFVAELAWLWGEARLVRCRSLRSLARAESVSRGRLGRGPVGGRQEGLRIWRVRRAGLHVTAVRWAAGAPLVALGDLGLERTPACSRRCGRPDIHPDPDPATADTFLIYDLHWVDTGTLALLLSVRGLQQRRCIFFVTYRADEASA